ncbi:MAG TPA: peptidase C39 family protein [Candidatus Deferrimicrobium sp.]
MTVAVPFRGAAMFLCGALFIGGCAAGIGPGGRAGGEFAPGPEVVIPGVPFLPQAEETCGPSSLAMLLRFLGKKAETAEIAGETRTAGLRGTLITDLAAAARRRGVDAEVVDLDPAGLRAEIDAGRPVILLVDLGVWVWSRPHYLLVYGYGPRGYVAHSGRTAGQEIPASDLSARWAKMGRLAIVARGAAR